jgi:hypothetical protein
MPSGRRSTAEKTRNVPSRSTEVNDGAIPANDDVVMVPRVEFDAMNDRLARLERTVASRTGTDTGQQVMRQTTTVVNGGFDLDPHHDSEFLKWDRVWFLSGGREGAQERQDAYAAAKLRIAAQQQNLNQPVRNDQYDWSPANEQRQAMAQARPDMSMVLSQGGVSTRSPSGQVTTVFGPQRTCQRGHPAKSDKPFCGTCGTPIGAPGLGEDWADRVPQDEALAAERRREEGIED